MRIYAEKNIVENHVKLQKSCSISDRLKLISEVSEIKTVSGRVHSPRFGGAQQGLSLGYQAVRGNMIAELQ